MGESCDVPLDLEGIHSRNEWMFDLEPCLYLAHIMNCVSFWCIFTSVALATTTQTWMANGAKK